MIEVAKGSITGRYEAVQDKTGAARLEADVFTGAFNWRTSNPANNLKPSSRPTPPAPALDSTSFQ